MPRLTPAPHEGDRRSVTDGSPMREVAEYRGGRAAGKLVGPDCLILVPRTVNDVENLNPIADTVVHQRAGKARERDHPNTLQSGEFPLSAQVWCVGEQGADAFHGVVERQSTIEAMLCDVLGQAVNLTHGCRIDPDRVTHEARRPRRSLSSAFFRAIHSGVTSLPSPDSSRRTASTNASSRSCSLAWRS